MIRKLKATLASLLHHLNSIEGALAQRARVLVLSAPLENAVEAKLVPAGAIYF